MNMPSDATVLLSHTMASSNAMYGGASSGQSVEALVVVRIDLSIQ